MNIKQYQTIRLITTIVLAIIFSQALVIKSFTIPVMILIAGSVFLFFIRRRVKEVIADERDYFIGGQSALLAMQIFSWIAVVCMFGFYSFRDLNPLYEPIGILLGFSVAFLMILYSIIFYLKRGTKINKKKIIFAFVLALIFAAVMAGARIIGGEDSWMCINGQWQKHGNPSAPIPNESCIENKLYSDGEKITWSEAEKLIKSCQAENIFQAHSKQITLTLLNGIRLNSEEPNLDDIIKLAQDLRTVCPMKVATE